VKSLKRLLFTLPVAQKALTKILLLFTTVVQKLNQCSTPKTGCYRFRVAFFVSFLAKQKRKIVFNMKLQAFL
jgi:hypothetical protein